MSEFRVIRDKDRCVVCLECIQVCPQSQPGVEYPVIVESENKTDPPVIANPENCIQCLTCFRTCRAMAITLEGYHKVERLVKNAYLVREARKMI